MGTVGPKLGPPSSSLTPPPAPLVPPLSSASQMSPVGTPGSANTNSTGPTSSLEMLLVERAKAIQQANPALKAFADMQGKLTIFSIKVSRFHEVSRKQDEQCFQGSIGTWKLTNHLFQLFVYAIVNPCN